MRTLFVPFAASLALAPLGQGQVIPFSQRGTISQTVGFTEITVSYRRPVARGRVLFPGVVRWDQVWTPGADSATRIRFDHELELEGRTIPPGEYSLWLIPRENRAWTAVVSRAAHVFHTPYPGEEHDVLRLDIPPETGPHTWRPWRSISRWSGTMRRRCGCTGGR